MDLPEHFQVKARVPSPIEELWPDYEIEVIDWADYRFRITISKDEVIPVLIKEIESVLYTSFKNACEADETYQHALVNVWTTMYNYQLRIEAMADQTSLAGVTNDTMGSPRSDE
ncbi:uncharacterized protein METZ01_LOCUS218233 [marine metagenome]|uniref:Uncharacterized protein n=1 Tax=marine metagenome TaxID=408172 RepID=A0A382FRU6_9ZZZZ